MSTTATVTRSSTRTVLRWLVSFTGFPLGGLAAMLFVGPADAVLPALAGGLVTGAVLGAVQAWALRLDRATALAWAAATALGLAAGLALGGSAVSFGTTIGALTMPVYAAGVTFVIGRVFMKHFASGGTLLDFDPPDYKEFIKAQQEKVASKFGRGKSGSAA